MPTAKKTGKTKAASKKTGSMGKAPPKRKSAGKPKAAAQAKKTPKQKSHRKVSEPKEATPVEKIVLTDIVEQPVLSEELVREEILPAPEMTEEPAVLPDSGYLEDAMREPAREPQVEAGPELNSIEQTTEPSILPNPERTPEVAKEELQLVCFTLNNEEYGLDIIKVQEINRVPELNEVPDTPDFVKGVINLRGRIIPVIEMRLLLGLPDKEYDHKTRVVVLDNAGTLTGIVVDDVTQVLRIKRSSIVNTPDLVATPGKEFLEGIYQHDQKLILVIDCDRIFRFNI